MNNYSAETPFDLRERAERAAREAGFQTRFSPAALDEVEAVSQSEHEASLRDLRGLLWSSIDNEESRDLDQVEWCERVENNGIRVLIGIADVAIKVLQSGAIDAHAAHNTVSIYTGVEAFPMLPEALSNDATSLLPGRERAAVVMDMTVDESGDVIASSVYRARVRNAAKLVYETVGDWLDGEIVTPPEVARVPGLEEQIRLQWEVAQRLHAQRGRNGALDVDLPEARPVVVNGRVTDLQVPRKNSARLIIENFMVTANMTMAHFLAASNRPTIQRVVREPDRWPRIVELAQQHGATLPAQPNAPALSEFLTAQRHHAPENFGELSLSILKLLGRGEYVVTHGNKNDIGHFGLGMQRYAHSTAPNRRFPDLVTQRTVQAQLENRAAPYSVQELESIAAHCSEREGAAQKVERLMRKVAAAALLHDRIGHVFDAVITGASKKGVYARATHPMVEGRVTRGERDLDVGDKVPLRLLRADPERGHIDFERV